MNFIIRVSFVYSAQVQVIKTTHVRFTLTTPNHARVEWWH